MPIILSPIVRQVLYIITGIGSIIMAYLFAESYVGDAEMVAWSSFTVFISAMAGFNVNPDKTTQTSPPGVQRRV